jgi:hypothetical protein
MAATTNLAIQKAASSASSERRLPQYRVLMGILSTLNLNLISGSGHFLSRYAQAEGYLLSLPVYGR